MYTRCVRAAFYQLVQRNERVREGDEERGSGTRERMRERAR